MCKWMQKQVEGIDVFQVGKQQLWDWCGWTREGYRVPLAWDASIYMYADTLRKGVYVLVETGVVFGRRWSRSSVIASFTSLRKAVKLARLYSDLAPDAYETSKVAHGYEIWHVVDDAELWQEWDNASAAYIALHQPEVPQYQPVIVDEQDTDYGRDTLCSVYVPAVGQNVSFLVCEYDATGETVEYVNDDWQGWQPLRLDRICYLNWHNAEEIANGWDFSTQLLESLRQLREAGAIA